MATLRALIEQFADTRSGAGRRRIRQRRNRRAMPARGQRAPRTPAAAINSRFTGAARSPALRPCTRRLYRRGQGPRGFLRGGQRRHLVSRRSRRDAADLQAKFLGVLRTAKLRLGETEECTPPRASSCDQPDLCNGCWCVPCRSLPSSHRAHPRTCALRSRGDDWRGSSSSSSANTQAASARSNSCPTPRPCSRPTHFRAPRELRNIVIRPVKVSRPARQRRATQRLELDYAEVAAPGGGEDLAARIRAPGFRLDQELEALERAYIETALALGAGNLSQAARLLGVNRTTLYSRLARLGLGPGSES